MLVCDACEKNAWMRVLDDLMAGECMYVQWHAGTTSRARSLTLNILIVSSNMMPCQTYILIQTNTYLKNLKAKGTAYATCANRCMCTSPLHAGHASDGSIECMKHWHIIDQPSLTPMECRTSQCMDSPFSQLYHCCTDTACATLNTSVSKYRCVTSSPCAPVSLATRANGKTHPVGLCGSRIYLHASSHLVSAPWQGLERTKFGRSHAHCTHRHLHSTPKKATSCCRLYIWHLARLP